MSSNENRLLVQAVGSGGLAECFDTEEEPTFSSWESYYYLMRPYFSNSSFSFTCCILKVFRLYRKSGWGQTLTTGGIFM